MKAYSTLKLKSSTRPQIVMEIYKGDILTLFTATKRVEEAVKNNYKAVTNSLEQRLFKLSELAPYQPYQPHTFDYDEDFDKEKDKINNALMYLEKLKNKICQK